MRCACARCRSPSRRSSPPSTSPRSPPAPAGGRRRSARFTSVHWEQLQKRNEPFSGLIAWSATRFNLSHRRRGALRRRPVRQRRLLPRARRAAGIGRTFTADDDRAGCGTPGAVISSAFWQREFGGDRSVARPRRFTLDGPRFPVIGVTPPQFFGVEVGNRFDVAVPLCADNQKRSRAEIRDAWWLSAMGRLKPGWTVAARQHLHAKRISPAIMEATLPPTYRPDHGQAIPRQQAHSRRGRHRSLRTARASTRSRSGCCSRPPAWSC